MKITIGELREQAERLLQAGEPLPAMRMLVAILRRAPQDLLMRLRTADALAQIGATGEAVTVYRTTAMLGIDGGLPLTAIVACRAAAALGGESDDLLASLADSYCRGSDRIGAVGGRLNIHSDARPVPSAELKRKLLVSELVDRALAAGGSLDGVGTLPPRFARVPVLSQLTARTLRAVLAAATVHRVPIGHRVIEQGDRGRSLFLTATGKLRVFDHDEQDRLRELATLASGSLFGELALISGAPRSASVEVAEAADLVELGPEALAAMGDELATVAESLERTAHERAMKNLLDHSLVFRLFSAEQRQQLLRRFQAHQVPANTVLFRQGDKAKGIYLVFSGEVSVVRGTGRSSPMLMRRFGPGGMLGVNSTLHDDPATASAVTCSPTTVLFISARFVGRLLEAVPEFTNEVGAVAAHRARITSSFAAIHDADEDAPTLQS